MVVPLLLACNKGQLYDNSADVRASAWTPADTLSFPIWVDTVPTPRYPLLRQQPCRLSLGVRFELCYPLPEMDLHFRFSHIDTLYHVHLPLGDEEGRLKEDWVSVQVREFDITHCAFSFPDSGSYLLQVWPDQTLNHILSITATLR